VELNILRLRLNINSVLKPGDAERIRGYLGDLFWENPYVHQHTAEGRFIYRYPRVQYKVIGGVCILIGFSEGIHVLKKTFDELKEINLNGEFKEVFSKGLESYAANFALSSNQISYSFLTPWLALNEKNYEKYQKFGTWPERKKLLEGILVGNIISMSKSLGYTVPAPIEANINKLKPVKTSLKGVPMLGFLGTFSVNFEIPDYWGIGKSVSRGFGTIKRQNTEDRTQRTKDSGKI